LAQPSWQHGFCVSIHGESIGGLLGFGAPSWSRNAIPLMCNNDVSATRNMVRERNVAAI
jgi:hypothetical protein